MLGAPPPMPMAAETVPVRPEKPAHDSHPAAVETATPELLYENNEDAAAQEMAALLGASPPTPMAAETVPARPEKPVDAPETIDAAAAHVAATTSQESFDGFPASEVNDLYTAL